MATCEVCNETFKGIGSMTTHALLKHSREDIREHFDDEQIEELFSSKVREKPDVDIEEEQFGYDSGW